MITGIAIQGDYTTSAPGDMSCKKQQCRGEKQEKGSNNRIKTVYNSNSNALWLSRLWHIYILECFLERSYICGYLNKWDLGTGERAQWVKCLLCEHENQRSDLQPLHKKQAWWFSVHKHQGTEVGRSQGSLVKLVSLRFNEIPSFKI